jgi:hypothetical protein
VSTCARACPPVPPLDLHGKEGVDGSSPSEGSAKAPHDGTFLVGCICTISNMRQVWSPLWSLQVPKAALDRARSAFLRAPVVAPGQPVAGEVDHRLAGERPTAFGASTNPRSRRRRSRARSSASAAACSEANPPRCTRRAPRPAVRYRYAQSDPLRLFAFSSKTWPCCLTVPLLPSEMIRLSQGLHGVDATARAVFARVAIPSATEGDRPQWQSFAHTLVMP